MLIDESCYVKEAKVVDSTKIESNEKVAKERFLLNVALDLEGKSHIPDIKGTEESESGVELLLYSIRTRQEYRRFMPESLLRETIGPNSPPLSIENLQFFADSMKTRKEPIMVTVFSNEVEGGEYQNAVEASLTGEVKFKMIGKPKKKGNKK